jgi:Tfp pilus assembly PilM family ATPase
VKVAEARGAYTVPADGKIVAWTIALGKPTAEQVAFFDRSLGGPASARLTVLRQGRTLYSRTVSQSPTQRLAPYFGQTVQFPLGRALNVKKGYVIALTVPTWAPALTPLLTDQSSWRASRPRGKCNDTGTQTAQRSLDLVAQYRCLYKARLTYSATLVTRPVPNRATSAGA